MIVDNLPFFELERWQSLRENYAKILLSESGVEPLTLGELTEIIGEPLLNDDFQISYGWTGGSLKLRKTIAETYSAEVDENNILVTNGSSEANFIVVLSTIREGDVAIVEKPNYMQIINLLTWRRAKAIEIWRKPENNFKIQIEELLDLISKNRPKAVFLTNPNNPTGQYLTSEEIREIHEEASKHHAILVFDEVYRGLEHNGEAVKSILETGEIGNIIAVSSLSKAYGLPGLRIGWIAADSTRVMKMWSLKDYTSIAPSKISDEMAFKSLQPGNREKIITRAKEIVNGNKEILREISGKYPEAMEIHWPHAGAFFLGEFTWSRNSVEICEKLFKEHGVLICPGETFGLKGYARIGMGQSPSKYRDSLIALFEGLEKIRRN